MGLQQLTTVAGSSQVLGRSALRPTYARPLAEARQVTLLTRRPSFAQGQQWLAWSAAASATCVGARRGYVRQRRLLGPVRAEASLVSSPPETYQIMVEKAECRAKFSGLQCFVKSIFGGCYIGFAGLLAIGIAGKTAPQNFIVSSAIFAALFPISILFILQSGSQLFTNNAATMCVGLFEGKLTLGQLGKNWIMSFLGNFVGCAIMACMSLFTGMLVDGVRELAIAQALLKCSGAFGPTVVKAIMANWLITMAVWLAWSARDLTSKMVGIWFPISMQLALGFEHSVANMFMLSAGKLAGAPISLSTMLLKSLIPVTIGNIFAGVVIYGLGFSFAFGRLGKGW